MPGEIEIDAGTKALSFNDCPINVEATIFKKERPSFMPPALRPQNWVLNKGFTYAVGSLENPKHVIEVERGFVFDGATVPFIFTLLFPKAHPLYMKAACLHDWLYDHQGTFARREVDLIFLEALLVLGCPKIYAKCMFYAVRLGGWLGWNRRKSNQTKELEK